MAIEPIKGFYVHDEATDTDGVAKYDANELDGDIAELADIRVGYDGTTYASAGDAVRGQALLSENRVDGLRGVLYDNNTATFIVSNVGGGVRHDFQIEKGKKYTISVTYSEEEQFSNVWLCFADYKSNVWAQDTQFTSTAYEKVLTADDFHDQIRIWYPETYTGTFTITVSTAPTYKLLESSELLTRIVTPFMFGAYGDNVHDDSAAFQLAINSGKPVFIPAGSYFLANYLTLPTGSVLRGAGAGTTKLRFSCDGYCIRTVDQSHDVEIANFSINGSNRAAGIHLVCTTSASLEKYDVMHYVHNLYIENTTGEAFMVDAHVRESLIDFVRMYQVYTGMVLLGTDNRITNIIVGGCDRAGYLFGGSCNFINNIKAFVCCRNWVDGFAIRFVSSTADIVSNIFAQQNHYNGIEIKSNYSTYSNVMAEWNNFENTNESTNDINIDGIGNVVNSIVLNGAHNTETSIGLLIGENATNNTINLQYSNISPTPQATPIVNNGTNNSVTLNGTN